MSRLVLDAEVLARALALRDLSDEQQGAHALQLIVRELLSSLSRAWQCKVLLNRDNYDRLHYPADGAARSARYTRYVSENTLLRTQTSAAIPPLLRNLAAAPPDDVLLACPGLVYRRDTIDRAHTGEPHQIDLWRIRRGARLSETDLREMIALVVTSVLPGCAWRCVSAEHPYTTAGRQIDVQIGDQWLEIGECGLALGEILLEAALPDDTSGLAMGLGLDRLLMLRKGIDDIRLLRSRDPRVQAQLLDLEPYRALSRQPAIRRDLSILVDRDDTPEELGDRVRAALGERVASVEAVEVLSETRAADLPEQAARRLKIEATQKNVLLRVVLRDLEKTLTHDEANQIRDQIYAALHRGTVYEWASGGPRAH
jgi:phenylalanyl-tRNA synthetase alpha chain